MLTAAVTSLLIVVAGVTIIVHPWVVFQRFHAEALIPQVATLAILRDWGPWGAAVTASFFVTAIEHNRGRLVVPPASDERTAKSPIEAILHSRAGFVGMIFAATPLLYAPVSALALASSMVTANLCLGQRPGTFFELVDAGDFLHGVLLALLFGCVPAGWSLFGTPLTRTLHRGIAFKLWMTWFVMLGVSLVGQLAVGLVGTGE